MLQVPSFVPSAKEQDVYAMLQVPCFVPSCKAAAGLCYIPI